MRKEESHTRWKRTRTRNAGIIYNKGSEWKGRVSVVVCCLEVKGVGIPSFFSMELGHEGLARRDVEEWTG